MDYDALDEFVNAMNKRGHATMFARRDNNDKPMIERCTARDWARSMLGEFGVKIVNISNASDPPDCIGSHDDQSISIELTELVKGEILKKIARVRKGKEVPVDLFDQAQWNTNLLRAEINRLIDAKQTTYAKRTPAFHVDVLIVHSDERWLNPFQVKEWLADAAFETRPNIRNAYLLLTSFPGYADYWPVFRLYGTL